jgi:hypothetical protein
MAELNSELILKTVLPRVLKAAVWGTFTFVMVYYLPLMLIPQDIPKNILPFDYTAQLLDFAVISVFFAVVGQLFSGTVIGCGFGIARALVIIVYFFAVSEGGVFSVTLPISEFTVKLAVDISILLLMIISVNLLSIAKNLFEAITLLTEKSTRIDFT